MDFQHSIQSVARRTGLKAHRLRMWERRYGAVIPQRTLTGRRIYSEKDVRRLKLLKQATDAGESIGRIAGLSDADLLRLIGEGDSEPVLNLADDDEVTELIEKSHAALMNLDAAKLEATLLSALSRFGSQVFLQEVLAPLLTTAGDRWLSGQLRVADEHLLTATVRSILGSMIVTQNSKDSGPTILFTTPPGQHHELGLLMASVMASSIGWNAVYLGPDIPVEDISAAAADKGARAVALSIIYPIDDPRLPIEMAKLRRLLADDIQLIVGGRGANFYRSTLSEIGALPVGKLEDFKLVLSKLLAEPNSLSQGPVKPGPK